MFEIYCIATGGFFLAHYLNNCEFMMSTIYSYLCVVSVYGDVILLLK